MASDKLVYESVGTSGISYARACKLGEGGFAIVYLGSFNGRQVAVKKIQIERIEDREVKLQRSLEHENVLKLLEVEEDKDFRFLFYSSS